MSTKKVGRFTVTTTTSSTNVVPKSRIYPVERRDTNVRRDTNANGIVYLYGIEPPSMRCVKFTKSNAQHWTNTYPEYPVFVSRRECEQHAKEEANIAILVEHHLESTRRNEQQPATTQFMRASKHARMDAIRKAMIKHTQYTRPEGVVLRSRTAQMEPGKQFKWRNQAANRKGATLVNSKLHQSGPPVLSQQNISRILSRKPTKPSLKKNAK